MSKPNLSVAIEPLVGSSIVYEPVAPKEAGGKPQGVLCLRLAITNHESKSIHMADLLLSGSNFKHPIVLLRIAG